jgi:protein TonB
MSTAFATTRARLRASSGLAITLGVHLLLGGALLTLGAVRSALAPDVKPFKVIEPPAPVQPDNSSPPPLPADLPVVARVDPPILTVEDSPVIDAPPQPVIALPGGAGSGLDGIAVTPPAEPVVVDARLDQRFASRFQPPYPASAQRAEQEGVVSVCVLVGADGRVRRAEVAASSGVEALDRAATEHAVKAWRFRPATRDGVPVESWRTIPVRFALTGG